MKRLRRLFGLDDAGRSDDGRPADDVVWVATVALWQGPLIVQWLAEQRIEATYAESSARRMIYGGAAAARIYVHQAQRAEAEQIILELTGNGRADSTT